MNIRLYIYMRRIGKLSRPDLEGVGSADVRAGRVRSPAGALAAVRVLAFSRLAQLIL